MDQLALKLNLTSNKKILKNGSNVSPRFIKIAAKKILAPLLKNKDYTKAQGIMKEIMRNVIEEDLFPYLNNIHSDTLLIWGDKDSFVPLKDAIKFESEIDKSKLVVIDDAGHSAFKTHPNEFLKIVTSFLN
jgi:pimeloyl-ACP methyl ester carboxylesterase